MMLLLLQPNKMLKVKMLATVEWAAVTELSMVDWAAVMNTLTTLLTILKHTKTLAATVASSSFFSSVNAAHARHNAFLAAAGNKSLLNLLSLLLHLRTAQNASLTADWSIRTSAAILEAAIVPQT